MVKKINSSDSKKLNDDLINLKKNLMNLVFKKYSGQLENTSDIKKTKKDIARLKTKINIISNGVSNA